MEKKPTDYLLNSLATNVAVLDARGYIVSVNEQWKRFARENGGDDKTYYIGTNYFSMCEEAIRHGGDSIDVAEAVLIGIHELLEGKRESFSVEYPCHSPNEKRWFSAHITPVTLNNATYVFACHENITEYKLAEDKHHETESTLSKVLDTLPIGVWIIDKNGQIVHGNPAGQQIWAGIRYVGIEQFDMFKGWWLHTGRPLAAHEWGAARAIQKGETSLDEEIIIECFDGSRKIILHSAVPMYDAEGNIGGAIVVNQDITSRKRAEEKLVKANAAIDAMNRELQQVLGREQFKARTDELTGLSNRRYFFELSEQLFTVAQRYGTQLSIFIFDIDNFKRINDTFGHHIGDKVLKHVAKIAREHTRHADVLARYGGEEFIMMLPNTGGRGAFILAENIRDRVAAYRESIDTEQQPSVTISAGVAEIQPSDETLDALIQRADKALYEAKHAGRNCTRMFAVTEDTITQ